MILGLGLKVGVQLLTPRRIGRILNFRKWIKLLPQGHGSLKNSGCGFRIA